MNRTHATLVAGALALAAALTPLPARAQAAAKPGQQQAAKLDKPVTVTHRAGYLLFLPDDYGKEPEKKWPVILFLHGSGERGTDLNLVKLHGPPKIVGQQKDFPFVVISPQCPDGQWWQPATLIALLDEVIEKYAVDPDRVYLTGLSMGGFGTWQTAIEYPDRFAAIAPICGGGNRYLVPGIKHVPTWVFHGAKDQAVPVQASQEMAGVLQKVGGHVRLTIYPEAGHDSWTQTYDHRALYDWFLTHKRGAPGPRVGLGPRR
jgi:predicted peptidase